MRVLHQFAEVHHVVVALLAGVAAVIFRGVRAPGEGGEKLARIRGGGLERLDAVRAVSGRQRGGFRDVGEGQRRHFFHVVFFAAFHIGVADRLAESRAAHGGVPGQRADPAAVVPAAARLDFLRGHHVAGKAVDRAEGIDGGHQAGVEADEFEGRVFGIRAIDRIKGGADFVEAHDVVGAFVEADAARAAAAVVPEDEDAVVGGEVFLAEAQEVLKRRARAHVCVGRRAEVVQAVGVVEEPRRAAGRNAAGLPFIGASGLDHDFDVGRQADALKLRQIIGGRAVLRFEVGAAEIPIDDPGVGRAVSVGKVRGYPDVGLGRGAGLRAAARDE